MTANQRLVLPFTLQSENRKNPLTQDMERAAIYCVSELGRVKKGRLLTHLPEKTAFLTKIYYPLWQLPWSGIDLVFDGLGTFKHDLHYKLVPDSKVFETDLTRGSKTLENYANLLQNHANYFQNASHEGELALAGLLTGREMLEDLDEYMSEAKPSQDPLLDGATLDPTLDATVLKASVEELDGLKLQFQQELEALASNMKLLNETTKGHLKTLRSKTKATKEQYAEKIQKLENKVAPQLARIHGAYDGRIVKLTQEFENQLTPLQKEKTKLEKTKERTTEETESSRLEAKTAKARHDRTAEANWKGKVKELRKQASDINKQIQAIQKKTEEIQKQKSIETFKLKSEFDTKTTEAKKELLETEAARDSEIQNLKLQIENLQQQTDQITSQMEIMAKMREADIENMGKLGIRKRNPEPTLALMPIYIVCYKLDSKKRYVTFPPSAANNVSLSAKLKGALGMAKIKQLLNPRLKAITSFVSTLPMTIEKNGMLERELAEKSPKTDMLKSEPLKQQVKNGIELLHLEGWFSEKEYATFKQELT